jgi:uncharacterized membrane protein YjgN (DUF898 family)
MPAPSRHRLSFHGTGGALFGIHIVTLLLSLVTLGIYSFWGRTKVGNTSGANGVRLRPLRYHAPAVSCSAT